MSDWMGRLLSIVVSVLVAVTVSVAVAAMRFYPACASVGLPWYCGIPLAEWLVQ